MVTGASMRSRSAVPWMAGIAPPAIVFESVVYLGKRWWRAEERGWTAKVKAGCGRCTGRLYLYMIHEPTTPPQPEDLLVVSGVRGEEARLHGLPEARRVLSAQVRKGTKRRRSWLLAPCSMLHAEPSVPRSQSRGEMIRVTRAGGCSSHIRKVHRHRPRRSVWPRPSCINTGTNMNVGRAVEEGAGC